MSSRSWWNTGCFFMSMKNFLGKGCACEPFFDISDYCHAKVSMCSYLGILEIFSCAVRTVSLGTPEIHSWMQACPLISWILIGNSIILGFGFGSGHVRIIILSNLSRLYKRLFNIHCALQCVFNN